MKVISIVCVTLGKRNFKIYLDQILKIKNYHLIELIVIDDSGNIENILKEKKYSKIYCKYFKYNKHILECFRYGFSKVTCDYAMWLNDDDYIIYNDFIELVKNNSKKYPNIDIFYGDGYYCDNNLKIIRNANVGSSIEKNAVGNFQRCYGMLQPSFYFKKELINTFSKLKFDSIFDVEFVVLNMKKKFKFINKKLSYATIDENTITGSQKFKQLSQHFLLLSDNNIFCNVNLFRKTIENLKSNFNRILKYEKIPESHLERYCKYLHFLLSNNMFFKNNIKYTANHIKLNSKINLDLSFLDKFYLNNINKHLNRKILVLGNGPSCKKIDFKRVRIPTLGMNSAYRYWYKINWFPDIYVCLDPVVVKCHQDNIVKLINEKRNKFYFLDDTILIKYPNLKKNNNILFLGDITFRKDKKFCSNFSIFNNGLLTTGSWSIRLSLLLGYSTIYFCGIDCNYVNFVNGSKRNKGIELEIVKKKNNPNYFFDGYQQKGDKYQIPNVSGNFHLRSINQVFDDIKNLKLDVKILDYGDNKKIKFEKISNLNKLYTPHWEDRKDWINKMIGTTNINNLICDHIVSGKPFSLLRSRSEDEVVWCNLKGKKLDEKLYKWMYFNCGVYPFKNNEVINHYINENVEAFKNMDFYLHHFAHRQDCFMDIVNKYNGGVIIGNYSNSSYPRHFGKNSWLNKLVNKKVLIISSFSDSIRYQYENKDLDLPKFKLITYSSVLSLAGNEIHKTWKDSLKKMKDDISKIDFDIALLACGGYGGPLSNHIKNIGKQAIYCGGGLQQLFFIRGKRWGKQDDPRYKNAYPHEIPKNLEKVGGGCYW